MTAAASVIHQLVDAFNAQDRASMRSFLAEDTHWTVLPGKELRGADRILDYLCAMSAFPTFEMAITEVLGDDGTNVTSITTWSAVQGDKDFIDAFTGEPIPIPFPKGFKLGGQFLNFQSIVNGKVTRLVQAQDTLPMAMAVMAATAS